MWFKRKLCWLILVLMQLFLFTGCGDLEPEMQDTRTVILKMDFDQRSSSRSSSKFSANDLNHYNTHLILAVSSTDDLRQPDNGSYTSNYRNNYSIHAQGLVNTADYTVSLTIPPYITQMKIFAFLFRDNYTTLEELMGDQKYLEGNLIVGNYGESQSFSLVTQQPISVSLKVPEGLTATGGVSQVVLDWTAVSGAASYTVYWGSATGVSSSSTSITSVSTDSYTHTGLNDGTTYYYKVAAVDSAGTAGMLSSEDNATTTMYPSLEAYYPFNGNANDESVNSYDGQLGNNSTSSTLTFPTLTYDRYGNQDKAYSFDGGDWIALEKYVTPNSISEITVCAWVLSEDNTSNKFIISFDRSESYRLALNDGGNSYVGWDTTDSDNNTDDLRTSLSYEDGEWHHICGWFKKSSTVDKKIFVDGDMVISRSNSHSGRNLGTSRRTENYGFIGWGSEASSFNGNGSSVHQNDFMIGKIDDVRIYSRSLSDEEISVLYLREKP